jgi:DNA polymerase-1
MIPKEARIILTVHDELVLTTPAELAEETAELLRQAMEDIQVLKVPLIADIKIVDRWGEAK